MPASIGPTSKITQNYEGGGGRAVDRGGQLPESPIEMNTMGMSDMKSTSLTRCQRPDSRNQTRAYLLEQCSDLLKVYPSVFNAGNVVYSRKNTPLPLKEKRVGDN